jgi:FecR protein
MADATGRDLGSGLGRLVRAARHATGGEVGADQHARGRERFEGALEGADRAALPVAARWPLLAAVGALALAAAIALVVWTRPLTYVVDGPVAQESYVRADASTATARFSDGTEVAFARGARGRIGEVTARGARVDVQEGRVSFRVVHRARAAWTAAAGPFAIQVTGTAFDVDWREERLRLDLHAGSVVVRGPLITDGLHLRAGQRLVADARARTFSVEEIGDPLVPGARPAGEDRATDPHARSVDASPASSAAPPDGSARGEASGAREQGTSARNAASWRELVARAEFVEVVKQAEARGLGASIAETPLAELAALADAARYVGRNDVARRALVAERERFPGSPEARSAAFLLGRLDEAGAPAQAVAWYDRYLAESPSGPLAGEALGRKMLTLRKTSGTSGARPAAEEYLRRFAGGPFADAAEEIVGGR